METKDKEVILETLKKLLVKKEDVDLENTISVSDLIRLTETAYMIRYVEVLRLKERMQEKLKSNYVEIEYQDVKEELEIKIPTNVNTESQIFQIVDGDLIKKEQIGDCYRIHKNLLQLIGIELQAYYMDIATNDAYISNCSISNIDYKIKFIIDDNFKFSNMIKLIIGDSKLKCSIEKGLGGVDYRINCDSYDLTNFIDENLDDLLDNIRIPKSDCPKVIVDMYENELMEQNVKIEEKDREKLSNKKDKSLIKSLFRKRNK